MTYKISFRYTYFINDIEMCHSHCIVKKINKTRKECKTNKAVIHGQEFQVNNKFQRMSYWLSSLLIYLTASLLAAMT